MKKRMIAAMMAATLAVTGLTGCGGSSDNKAADDTAKVEVPT